ncbi:MAG: hypothetical protein GX786_05765, partial [Clostridiales bacterium]|nr:hypothetical protein [Clostridiales bacterium]
QHAFVRQYLEELAANHTFTDHSPSKPNPKIAYDQMLKSLRFPPER